MAHEAPAGDPPAVSLDNLRWIRQAGSNQLVVGSQARILYADSEGRSAHRRGLQRGHRRAARSRAPVVLGRDHHDVSGTDTPYRETANIRDGSCSAPTWPCRTSIGDAFRGATWVSLHNGGGVGWGEVINGGFGMVLDGSADARPPAEEHAALGREQRHRPPRLGPQPERRVEHRTGDEADTLAEGDLAERGGG